MMTEVCQYLRNWFTRAQLIGAFTIKDGALQTQYDSGYEYGSIPLVDGQYFRIIGSALNDGVYQHPTDQLKDETFDGAVWTMAVPPAVVALANEITAWQEKYGETDSALLSPFSSESFGGYSYTKATGASADDASGGSWKSTFGARLAPWRKI